MGHTSLTAIGLQNFQGKLRKVKLNGYQAVIAIPATCNSRLNYI